METCTFGGCTNPRAARGLCARHYQRGKYWDALPPRKVRKALPKVSLTRDERNYLAGLFDGEGTACILKTRPPTLRRPTQKYELRVGVEMTHAATVQRFHELFGGRLYTNDRNRKRQYRWQTSQRLALRCMTTLAPSLRVKRRQAEIAVRFMGTFRYEHLQGRTPVSTEILNERVQLAEDMGTLNDSHWHQKRLLAKRKP